MYFYRLIAILMVSLLTIQKFAFAGISLDSTRIIFTESNEKYGQSIGVTSSLNSKDPYLVKAQVLEDTAGNKLDTPFSVTPSIFRLEPGSTNQLRILKTGHQKLDKNQESIFYLRVIAIPAGKNINSELDSELGGSIKVSTGSIIKLLYRPDGLESSLKQAMSKLEFNQNGNVLKVSNKSPYFITLSSLSINNKKLPISVSKGNTMIAPFGEISYSDIKIKAKDISWEAINDHGGLESFNKKLTE